MAKGGEFTTAKPRKLNQGRKKDTEGINIPKKVTNIKQLMRKFVTDNKARSSVPT